MLLSAIQQAFIYWLLFLFYLFSLIYMEINNFLSIPIFTLYFLIICSPILLITIFKNISIYSPSLFFSIAVCLYELPKYFLYIDYKNSLSFALKSELLDLGEPYLSSVYYLSYTLLCICVFVISERIFLYKVSNKPKFYSFIHVFKGRRQTIFLSSLALFGVSLAYFLYSSGGSIFFFLSARVGVVEAQDAKKSAYLFILFCIYAAFTLPYLLDRYKNRGLYVYAICVFLLLFLYTGARGFIIYTILAIVFWRFSQLNKIPVAKLGVLALLFVVIFSVMGGLRKATSDDFDSNKSITSGKTSIANYQLQLRDELIFSNLSKTDYFKLRSIFSPLLMLAPRSILGDLKPNMIDGEVAKILWGRDDIGLPINLSTELILNFGIGGFLYIPFLVLILIYFKKIMFTKQLGPCYVTAMIYSQTFLSSKLVYVLQLLILLTIFLTVRKLFK